MKTSGLLPSVLLLLSASLAAQNPSVPPVPSATPTVHRTTEELDQLLAPVALYPDALIALILPASTVPADLVLAARQMRGSNNDRSQVESRAWDESVKSLTHYPDVLKWMDDNLDWTKQVGEAFLADPAAVMNAIQRLRARARAAGTLVDTPQQQVIASADIIRIVPAQRDVIYVPSYEPSIIYVDQPRFYPVPPLSFGVGFPVGSWLAYDCDWVHRRVWVGDRHRRWHGHDWHRPVVSIPSDQPRSTTVRHWQPSSRLPRPTVVGTTFARTRVITPTRYARPGSESRIAPATPTQPVNPLPRTGRTGTPREFHGPRAATAPTLPSVTAPALVRQANPGWTRNSRTEVSPGLPGPRSAVSTNPSPVTAPALVGKRNPGWSRHSEPRSRSLPNTIGGPLSVAPPLRITTPSLPTAGFAGPRAPAGLSTPLPATIAPPLPPATVTLAPTVPSLPAAPAYQNPAPSANRGRDSGDRASRRHPRAQRY